MKRIAIVTTGGTIAMTRTHEGVIPFRGGNSLVSQIPGLEDIAEVELLEFSNIPSPYMTPNMMMELSRTVRSLLERPDTDGVVVTHGTDTLEETSYFLDLTIDSEKPVVFTAAMRNINELGTDGPRNVLSSVRVAATDEAKGMGVMVCLNDEVHAAREVTKTYTSNVATFDSPGYGPLGIVDEDSVIFFRKSLTRMHIDVDDVVEKVALVKTFTGDDGSILKKVVEMGYEGIVLEGFGRGNVPPKVADVVGEIARDIPVVITSRCFKGRVLDVYGYKGGGADLVKKGAILGQEVSSQKARIKLMLVLAKTRDVEEIRAYFETSKLGGGMEF